MVDLTFYTPGRVSWTDHPLRPFYTMSEWKEQRSQWSIERRTRSDGPPLKPVPSGTKDGKRWCRGQVGVEHQFEETIESAAQYAESQVSNLPSRFFWPHCSYADMVCAGCGNRVQRRRREQYFPREIYLPGFWETKGRERLDFVIAHADCSLGASTLRELGLNKELVRLYQKRKGYGEYWLLWT